MSEEKIVEEKPKSKSKPIPKKNIGIKLGSINNKAIYCGQKCPKCPKKNGDMIRIEYIKNTKGKLIKLKCKDY